MPIYQIIEIEVQEPEAYAEYVTKVPELVRSYGGRYLARGDEIVSLAGDWRPERVILLEFPSMEALQACYASPEYQALAPLRVRSTRGRSFAIQGCAEPV